MRLADGTEELADVVRALDAEGIRVADLAAPRADARRRLPRQDRALARGRRRRAAEERRPASTPARGRDRRGAIELSAHGRQPRFRSQARYLAWRSVIRTARQPIMIVPPLVFPLFLLAINASGLDAATDIPGFPTDSYLDVRARLPVHAGGDLRHQHRRHQPRRGHRQRLLQPPLADADARLGAARRPARRRAAGRRRSRRSPTSPRASPPAPTSRPGRSGVPVLFALSLVDLPPPSARSGSSSGCARARARPSRACSR